jgi:group I intron endonuclease
VSRPVTWAAPFVIKKMGVIYKILSPSGKIYIGKTKNFTKRESAYKSEVKKNKTEIIIHNSIRKYGWDAHRKEFIEEVPNDMLNEREIYWIAYFKTYWYDNTMGMNMTKGGDGNNGSWMHDIKRREKQAKRFTGNGNPFYGKHHTEEFKARKSKEVSEYNKQNGIKVPEWGIQKSRLQKIKPVLVYDNKGIFLREFESYAEATKFTKCSSRDIYNSVSGKRTHAKGYVFRNKTENYPLKIEIEVKQQTVKRAIITVVSGKMWEHPSAQEASEYFLIPKTTINRAAMYNNGKPIRTGHQFYYKDSLNQNRPRIAGRAA